MGTKNITGVILCGGKSSRFGSDKAFAPYKGQSFFNRIFQVMSSIFRGMVVVTHAPEKYQGLSAIMLEDEVPNQGPLGGIITALRFVRNQGGDAIFVVACDMPLLSERVIRRLLEADDGSALVAYHQETRIESLCALYRPSLLPLLESRLSAGIRDLQSLSRSGVTARQLLLPKDEKPLLSNINTREELRHLEHLYAPILSLNIDALRQ